MATLLPCGATIADPGDQPGDLITRARQIEFNGLLLGAGSPYRWKELTGWDDMPSLDLGDSPRPDDHGDFPGIGYYQSRMPSLTMTVHGDTIDATEQLLTLLRQRAAYSDTEVPLVICDSGATLWSGARVVARSIPHQPQRTVGVAAAGVQWKCSDTRRYGMTSHSVHLVPGLPSGGLAFPLVFPLDFGTEGDGATATLTNAGDTDAPAKITFTGPGNGYSVALPGLLLKVWLPLTATDTLTIDTREGTVLLNDSSDRTDFVGSEGVPPEMWRIPPGDTTCTFAVAEGADVTTSVDIEWTDSNT